jgi:hypothetical protein
VMAVLTQIINKSLALLYLWRVTQRSKDLTGLLGGASEVAVVDSCHHMIMQDLEGVKATLAILLALTSWQ